LKLLTHPDCPSVNSCFPTNQVERPETPERRILDGGGPKACSPEKLMLLTLPKAGTVHACEDEVPQQVLVKAFGILVVHFCYKDTHLVHVSGEQKVAVSQAVQLCSIPWKLPSGSKSVI
jgi:hypothetical protein